MRNAKQQLLSILPQRLRQAVDVLDWNSIQELRLRINAPPEIIGGREIKCLNMVISQDDLHFVINTASRYSPWAAASLSKGYLTVPGGHRIGVCGETVLKNGIVTGITAISSLSIRIAKDLLGIAPDPKQLTDSFLIIGAPGWGKTTLLRDMARSLAERETVCVVDEREELFPDGFQKGNRMDVLKGCPKHIGIEMLIRTMSPNWIAVDEITAESDCIALAYAANCGVRLAATAHAASLTELRRRPVYSILLKNQIFKQFLVLSGDKSYKLERLELCTTNGSGRLS